MAIGVSTYAEAVLGEGSSLQIDSGDKAGTGTGSATNALDTASTLLRATAPVGTTLWFPIAANETTIRVASTEGFTADGAVLIDGECVTYTGISGTEFTGCSRGRFIDEGYRSAAAHEIGTAVVQEVLPSHHRVMSDAVRALQARTELLLVKVSVNVMSETEYTLKRADWGRLVLCMSDDPVTVTVPELLPTGYRCRIAQYGEGTVTVEPAPGLLVQVLAVDGNLSTSGQYGVLELLGVGANTYLLTGDTGP